MPERWHVIPINDVREHEESVDCACRPFTAEDGRVIVHNAWDKREIIEELTLRQIRDVDV